MRCSKILTPVDGVPFDGVWQQRLLYRSIRTQAPNLLVDVEFFRHIECRNRSLWYAEG